MEISTTIQDVLGVAPFMGTEGLDLNAYTRSAARTWLCKLGLPMKTVGGMSVEELTPLYSDHGALNDYVQRQGMTAIEYNDAQALAAAPYAPRNEKLLSYLTSKRDGLFNAVKPAGGVVEPKAEAVRAVPKAAAAGATLDRETAGKGALLAALIADLAGSKTQPLDEDRVVELIKQHAAPAREIVERFIVLEREQPAAEPRALKDQPRHAMFMDILTAVTAGGNVMVVGPAGSGKTHLAAQIAEALGRPFYFTGAIASEYKLTGFIDAQGRIVCPAFRKAYEHGGVFLFDEMDASAPQALLAFNAALSNGHMDFPDACIERHPDFAAIASANTYGRGQDRVYVGRNQLDAASLDRFDMIHMDYDHDLEAALFGRTDWLRYVHDVRAAVAMLNVRHVVSMRAIDRGTKLIKAGMARDKVEALALWKGLDAATVTKIKAAI